MILKNIITLIFQVTLFIFPLLTNAACDKCDQILKQNGVSIQNGSCKNLPSVASTSLLNCCTNQCISQINIPSSNIGNSWGNAPEQFGLQFGEEIETLGPHTFFSDAKGYQYVVDSVNERISIQDEKGSLVKNVDFKDWAIDILVDEQENMFILGKTSLFIVQASGVQKNYPLSDEIPEVEGYGQGFWQDNADNVYICKQQQCYQIAKQQSSKIEVLSPNEQADSIVPGYPLGNKQFIRTEWQNQHQAVAQILNDNWQVTQEIKLETDDIFGAIQFVQQDKSGHFYFEIERITDDDSVNLFLQKYDDKGKLASEELYPNDYYSTVYKRIFVDKQGKTQQLFTTSQGVSLAANTSTTKQPNQVSSNQTGECGKDRFRIVKFTTDVGYPSATYKYNSNYLSYPYADEVIYSWNNWVIRHYELIVHLVLDSINCSFNGVVKKNQTQYEYTDGQIEKISVIAPNTHLIINLQYQKNNISQLAFKSIKYPIVPSALGYISDWTIVASHKQRQQPIKLIKKS
ncbi:MAG: hypothetical protein VSS52_001105 [Thiotrichaceae bacterium]|nr:hypothetical protein [Thiotrichaceae bacterium]